MLWKCSESIPFGITNYIKALKFILLISGVLLRLEVMFDVEV